MLSEIAWTRLASVWFLGDTTYLLVTVAVAGLSLGAAVATARPTSTGSGRGDDATVAAWWTAGAVATWIVLALVAPKVSVGGAGLVAAALLPTFAALGWTMTTILTSMLGRSAWVLATDLVGAALGAAIALPAIAWTGAHGAIAWAGAMALVATAVRVPIRGRIVHGTFAAVAVALAVAASVGAVVADGARPWDAAGSAGTRKSLTFELDRGGTWLASRWGATGRSDLVRRVDGAEILYLDGSAGSLVPTPDTRRIWLNDPGRFPFEALSPSSVFVVGGGAGLEVVHALETGASSVLVAEVAGAGVDLAHDFWSRQVADGVRSSATPVVDPFDDPRVTWTIDEARATLAATGGAYDLIHLSHAVTRTQELRGLASTENVIYTVEAFRGFLDHLRPGGVIAFESYDEASLERLVHTAAEALVAGGWAATDAQALRHMSAYLETASSPVTPVLLVHRDAPDVADVVRIARVAERRGLALLLLPHLLEPPPWDRVAAGTSTFLDVRRLAPDLDLSPTFDDAPFFWSFDVGAPPDVVRTWFVAAVAASLVALVAWASSRRTLLPDHALAGRPRARSVDRWTGGAWAWALGAAFLLAELALLSRATVVLGAPGISLAVTLASLLVGGGVAAWTSRHGTGNVAALARGSTVAAAATVVTFVAWPWLAGIVAAWPVVARATGVATVGVLLGASIGRPFPALLAWASKRDDEDAAAVGRRLARIWALDGAGMLVGGASAVWLAHTLGLRAVAIVAAAAYLAVAWWASTIESGDAVTPGSPIDAVPGRE